MVVLYILFLASMPHKWGVRAGERESFVFVVLVVSIRMVQRGSSTRRANRVVVCGGKWGKTAYFKTEAPRFLSTRPIHTSILVYTYSALVTVTPRCSHSSAAQLLKKFRQCNKSRWMNGTGPRVVFLGKRTGQKSSLHVS